MKDSPWSQVEVERPQLFLGSDPDLEVPNLVPAGHSDVPDNVTSAAAFLPGSDTYWGF